MSTCSYGQLVCNEFSQGENGSKEYIELVVTGKRTCRDSVADLRGWIIDDQNGWYGGLETGISTGHFRFKDTAAWERVPFGSIILIYNGEDKNGSIHQADDPVDSNKDNVFILPHNTVYFEVHNSDPASPSSPGFIYPTTGFTPPSLNDWALCAGLNNERDAIVLVNPANLGQASFSVYYGKPLLPPFHTPTVRLPSSIAAGQNCYLLNNEFDNSAFWKTGDTPAQETPGIANTAENLAWIKALQKAALPNAVSHIYACLEEGEVYEDYGAALNSSGTYTFTYQTDTGCDSTVVLHLTIPKTIRQTLKGCGHIIFEGSIFTASGEQRDTIRNSTSNCDSIYRITYLQIFPLPGMKVSRDTLICKGAYVILNAEAPNAEIQWLGYAPGSSIRVSPEQTAAFQVTALDSNGCADTATVTVAVEGFELEINRITSPVISGTELKLQTQGNLPYRVMSWSPRDLFASQNLAEQIIRADRSLEIEVVGRSVTGCIDSASIYIEVLPGNFYAPTSFTPNGDGKNDQFKVFPSGLHHFDICIFNRWGTLVFRSGDPHTGWDGKYKGILQPAGTFVYLVSGFLSNQKPVYKRGTVTLIY
ncbi:MAG TPA: gliding motility-associated C-terminal domain-containing protein [Flavisolibacter sp.]